MAQQMRYWRFRAYDTTGTIKVGVTSGTDGPAVILRIRQTGLQVFDLQTISVAEYRHFLHSQRTIKRFANLKRVIAGSLPIMIRPHHRSWLFWLLAGTIVAVIVGVSWLLLTAIHPR
jgi:hypothetical protein